MDFLGKTLGSYRIDRLLGEGGMGAVYQAFDLTLQREVAIKLIHPHYAHRPEFSERFTQEARLMARLDHPGIVKVYILGKEKDLLYLPMEFIRGGNLHQLLDKLIQQRKWLPLNEAVLLMRQLCQTVNYAHEHGVLHRDIKPDNLMLKPEPTEGLPFRVVLTDLGLAKLLQGLGMTEGGMQVGTPSYMSPEQSVGRNTDARSDVYALGILLYQLAAGRLPFPIRTTTEAVHYHTQERPPSPRSIRPDLPEALERVILKSLEKAPGNRYASAALMAEALKGIASFPATSPDQRTQPDSSLSTVYDRSLIEAAKPQSTSLMTMFGGGSLPPGGESIFVGNSVPPSSQTRIQVVYRDKTAQVFPFRSGTVTIGRAPNNDIPVSDPKASSRHAQISWDGMEYHVMDLGSTNGTYLDNTRLLAGISEVWRANQSLRVGDAWLRLIRPAADGLQPSGIRSGISSLRSRAGSNIYKSSGTGFISVALSPQQLSVAPGESVTTTISVLNQSPNVDHYSLSITGIPNSWIASLPTNVQLMPGEQTDAPLSLLIPRNPQSRAGQHPLVLRVSSQRDTGQFVEVKLMLTIAAFSQFKTELQPPRPRAGQSSQLTISNQGNALETFTIQFTDNDGDLTFEPSRPQMQVGPGETTRLQFHPKASHPRWVGGEQLHPFTAKVSPSNGEAQILNANLESRGSLPIWILPTLLLCLLITGALIAFGLLFNRPATLTVITNGSGTISSSPAGITNCNATCSSKFGHNANVALVAAPISPSTFGGWSGGGCSGTSLTCDLKLSEDQTVTAIFNPPGSQTLIVNVSGTGTVTSQPTGINCSSSNCSFVFPENTSVILTANPTTSSTFGGWTGGGCSGNALTCTVTMSTLQSVTATFNPPGKKTLTVNIVGTGNVTSSPPGIQNCGGPVCTFDFDDNTSVTLVAAPTSPFTFGGWGGACSNAGTSTTCTVTMNQAQNVIATFDSPANRSLTVTKSGSGMVTSSPPGVNCDPTCTFDFADNTPVTLTANAIPPFTFGGWGGACSSFGITARCSVTMNQAQNVTATFNSPASKTLTVSKAGTGNGTVTSSPTGLSCGATCTFDFADNTAVTLTASATAPSSFGGWSAACSSFGTSTTCIVTMNQAQNVTATFNTPPNPILTVNKGGTGSGRVISSLPGIDCGQDCLESYPFNTFITLTATTDPASTFTGWSGGNCSGNGTCTVTMNQAQNVTATFNASPNQLLTVTKDGTGTGMITSSPGGLDCGFSCSSTSFAFPFNTIVTLTASHPASTFDGWVGGGCSGAGTCTVTMDQARTVTANFTSSIVIMQPLTVKIVKMGTALGIVTIDPPGMTCTSDCSQSYPFNTTVTLTARAKNPASDEFAGWSGGGCSGAARTCTVTMNQAQTVTASFIPLAGWNGNFFYVRFDWCKSLPQGNHGSYIEPLCFWTHQTHDGGFFDVGFIQLGNRRRW